MVGLPETGGALSPEAVGPALKAIGRADAVVLGPGLSKSDGARGFALEMFERIDVPLVIDADGLNALEGVFPEDLPQRRWTTVLTPHAGELGRLLGVSSKEVATRRLELAREAAATARAFVVLKGDDTLIVSPGGRVAISRGGAPALATAGTGDVLAGVIGAMLAKGLPPAHAACAGVYAHVRAGQIAAGPHRRGRRHRLRRDPRAPRRPQRLAAWGGEGADRAAACAIERWITSPQAQQSTARMKTGSAGALAPLPSRR